MRELRVLAVVVQSIRIVRQRPVQIGSQLRTPIRRENVFNEQIPISMKSLDPLGDLFGGLLDPGERLFFWHFWQSRILCEDRGRGDWLAARTMPFFFKCI